MKENVLEVYYDEQGKPCIGLPEGEETAVVAATDAIRLALAENDKTGLNLLFATTVHLLSGVQDDKFLEQYIHNLRESYKTYHEAYLKAMKEMKVS